MLNPRILFLSVAALSFTVATSACEVAPLPNVADTAAGDTTRDTGRDTADSSTDTKAGGYTYCEVGADDPGCPGDMYCESTASVCVDCVGNAERCTEDGREVCAAPQATGIGELTGGFFEADPCSSDQVCVPDGLRASCETAICEPSAGECVPGDGSRALICNAWGTEIVDTACGPGRACYDGQCEFIRHNVLLIFDTSGSMHDYANPVYAGSPLTCEQSGSPCLEPFPYCDDAEDPLTLVTASKNAFAESIQASIGGFANFALQRFPQREAGGNQPNCWLGFYLPSDDERITGDDDSWTTQAGDWFDQGLGEAVVVPFPPRQSLDNADELLEWLDNTESLSPTDEECVTHSDCGTGRCGSYNGEQRCFYHSNNELRAGGKTPLGKSLFYAGEYFRRFVNIDDRSCTQDLECVSSGYVCDEGKCVDPYAKCKDNFIILFTDGEESEFPQTDAFFNPVVQAQRLAYGLNCTADTDCRGNATCHSEGVCLGPNQSLGDVPVFDAGAQGALSSDGGGDVSIRTTVIAMEPYNGNGMNARVTRAGGGAYLNVQAEDPETFRLKLLEVMRPDFKCQPEDLQRNRTP